MKKPKDFDTHFQAVKLVLESLRRRGLEAYDEVTVPSIYSVSSKTANKYHDFMVKLKETLRQRKEPVDLFGYGSSGYAGWEREFGRPIKPDVIGWRQKEDFLPYVVVEVVMSSDVLHKEIPNLQETGAPLKIVVDAENIVREGRVITNQGHLVWIVGANTFNEKLDNMIKYTDEHQQKN